MGRKPPATKIRRVVDANETPLIYSIKNHVMQETNNNNMDVDNDDVMVCKQDKRKSSSFVYQSMAREDHGQAIYAIAFSKIPGYESFFATVGTNRIMLYECLPDGSLDVVKVYVHEDVSNKTSSIVIKTHTFIERRRLFYSSLDYRHSN